MARKYTLVLLNRATIPYRIQNLYD